MDCSITPQGEKIFDFLVHRSINCLIFPLNGRFNSLERVVNTALTVYRAKASTHESLADNGGLNIRSAAIGPIIVATINTSFNIFFMPKLFAMLLLFTLQNQLIAQEAQNELPISVGYFGQFGFQPGVKVGTQFTLKSWSVSQQPNLQKSYFLSPQAGFFTWPEKNTNYLLNLEVGHQRLKSLNGRYFSYSIGLGYLLQSQIVGQRINLSDGSQQKIREDWGWLLTTANVTYGRSITKALGWYAKVSYGMKIAPERTNASVAFIELGLTYKL